MPRDRQKRRAPLSAEARITIGLMLATLAAKLFLALHYDGFLTGDDLEVVESGARYALGLPYHPWPLRCEFHPLVLVAPVLAVLRLAPRPPNPLTVAWLAAFPTALASTLSIGLIFRLGTLLGLRGRVSAAAAAFYALHWLPLGYGATPYPRPISTMLMLAALTLAADASRFCPLLGGALIGAAFAVRFSEAVLMAPFLLVALRTRRSASTIAFGAAGFLLGAAVCAGGADALTWGRPFQSLAEYFRIMYGSSPPSYPHYEKPWGWYVTSALQWVGPAGVLLAAFALPAREARLPLALFGTTVLAFSAINYKTYRYAQGAVPFLALLMAIGWERAAGSSKRWQRWAALALMVAAPAWGIERTVNLLRDKSMDAVQAGRWIRERHPRAALLEQGWAYGGILVLGEEVAVRDLEPRRPLALKKEDLEAISVAAFYEADLSAADRGLLFREGFHPAARFARYRKAVVVYRPAEGPGDLGAEGLVALPQDLAVVHEVPRGDVRERAHRERIVARDPLSRPRLRWEVPEEGLGREPDGPKLLEMPRPRDVVRLRGRGSLVLIVTRQRAVEASGEPERAEREEPLGVVDVSEDLARAPLAGRIPLARALLRESPQERERVLPLSFQDGDDVLARNPVDVAKVIVGGLVPPRETGRSRAVVSAAWLLSHRGSFGKPSL